MSKTEYLERVRRDVWSLRLGDAFPPEDWLAAAWEIDDVRDAHTEDIARTVSKMGQLFYSEAYLTALGRSLSVARQVELFNRIRSHSPHREAEFRGRFERFFPHSRSALPAPLSRDEAMCLIGLDGASEVVLLDDQPFWTEDLLTESRERPDERPPPRPDDEIPF